MSEDSEPLKMEVEEETGSKRKSKTPKRAKTHTDIANVKGIILSVTKPSYTLKRGTGTSNTEFESFRWLNRKRLSRILRKLMRRHNWDEAGGILSVLLKGTCKDKSVSRNRIKYLATMELLKHNKGGYINTRKFLPVFETWMKKIGTTKGWQTRDRYVVQLEFILFCLTCGDIEGARQAVLSLMQQREFGMDPISNLVVGLTYCHQWYAAIRKEFPTIDFDESCTPNQSEISESRFDMSIVNSKEDHDNVDMSIVNSEEDHDNAVEVQDATFPSQCDSDTSVRNDKEMCPEKTVNRRQQVSVDVDSQRETPHQSYDTQDFYVHSAESDGCKKRSISGLASIFYAHDLEPWLLPLQLLNSIKNLDEFLYLQKKIHNDYYKSALKHLRLALNSMPPMSEALLPLIQMLLLGDEVQEALDEVERFVTSSDLAIPLRLKACLLEHFDSNNHVNLATCFEDALKKDPTCSHSLTRLLNIHRNGDYSTEQLLEMIALHLDATYAESNTWKEFASCFLKLSQCEEDRMSICDNDNNDEPMLMQSNHLNKTTSIFMDGVLGKDWRFRCRWWLTRHFSQNMLISEMAAGDLELVTCKAASASHLYGRDFDYVVKALNCLEEDSNKDMLSFLQMHMQNCVGFYFNFKKKNSQ